MKDIQVDHIIPAGSLNDIKDIGGFVERLAVVTSDRLRTLCKPCHEEITLAETKGISIERAKVEKKVIGFLKYTAAKQREFLLKKGFYPIDISNQTKREKLFRACCAT